MSARPPWDEAQIHAYVDGALDRDVAARLEADSRNDANLAARVERQRALRKQLSAAFDPVLDEPIPQRLLDTLGRGSGATVTPIGAGRKESARASRPTWSIREWSALAATLVLGALLGPFVFRGSGDFPIESEQGRLVAADYLDTALSTQASGSVADGSRVRIDLSFRATGGEYCRTFALRAGASGLACRRDNRWSVELLDGAADASSNDGFRQASSALSPAMVGAIGALGGSAPLTAEQERERIGSGWGSDP